MDSVVILKLHIKSRRIVRCYHTVFQNDKLEDMECVRCVSLKSFQCSRQPWGPADCIHHYNCDGSPGEGIQFQFTEDSVRGTKRVLQFLPGIYTLMGQITSSDEVPLSS